MVCKTALATTRRVLREKADCKQSTRWMNRKALKGIALYNDLTRYYIDLAEAESEALVNQEPIAITATLIYLIYLLEKNKIV